MQGMHVTCEMQGYNTACKATWNACAMLGMHVQCKVCMWYATLSHTLTRTETSCQDGMKSSSSARIEIVADDEDAAKW